jgi:hypothetical protein
VHALHALYEFTEGSWADGAPSPSSSPRARGPTSEEHIQWTEGASSGVLLLAPRVRGFPASIVIALGCTLFTFSWLIPNRRLLAERIGRTRAETDSRRVTPTRPQLRTVRSLQSRGPQPLQSSMVDSAMVGNAHFRDPVDLRTSMSLRVKLCTTSPM